MTIGAKLVDAVGTHGGLGGVSIEAVDVTVELVVDALDFAALNGLGLTMLLGVLVGTPVKGANGSLAKLAKRGNRVLLFGTRIRIGRHPRELVDRCAASHVEACCLEEY